MSDARFESTLKGALESLQLDDYRPTGASDERYSIRCRIQGGYLAVSPNGHASLLLPLSPGPRALGRISGALSLVFRPLVYEFSGRTWVAPSALVECRDANLRVTFCALALTVAETAWRRRPVGTESPTPRGVSEALTQWERLLRTRRLLSPEEELGLWGELTFIESAPDREAMVMAWRGPMGETLDFHGGGVAFENKTSTRRLNHHFSQTQLSRPAGDFVAYLVSMWVGVDPIVGVALPELVDRLSLELANGSEFEEKLASAGYSRLDRAAYSRKFVLLEPPLCFTPDAVPRVREWDPGVADIRYSAELDESKALGPSEFLQLVGIVSSPTAEP